MGKVGEYVGIGILITTAIGIAFETAGQFVDREDQVRAKLKVEEFWFLIANLSTRKIVGEAIKLRRRKMRRKYVPLFLILYWVLLLLVISEVLYENIHADISVVRRAFEQSISTDFTARQIIIYNSLVANIDDLCPNGYENCRTDKSQLDQLSALDAKEDKFNQLVYDISQSDPELLRLISTAYSAFSISIVAIPLTLSLILSFNLTLFMLSLITKSSIYFVLILISDFLVALTFPPFFLTIFMYLGALISVSLTGPFIDYTTFENANTTSLVIGTSGVTSFLSFSFSGVAVLLSYFIIRHVSVINGSKLLLNLIYSSVYEKITAFFNDAWRVLHLDFNIDVIDSAINWAIFTDILYSLLFISPALLIVVIQRWPFGRRMLLNIVLWISAHPKGVIYAFGEALLSFISAVGNLISKKS